MRCSPGQFLPKLSELASFAPMNPPTLPTPIRLSSGPHEAKFEVPGTAAHRLHALLRQRLPADPEYPDAYEVFRTNKNGAMHWRGYRIQLNTSLDRQLVGVVRVGSEFDVRFGPVWLGRFKQPRRNTRNIRLITAPRKQQDAGRS